MKRTPLVRRTPLRPRSQTNSRQRAESAYLRWVRTLPCAVCDLMGRSEAAHTNVLGRSGMGRKTSNRSVIPLCPACHRLKDDSYHQITPESRWADYHGLDLPELVHRLNECFALMRAARCRAIGGLIQ